MNWITRIVNDLTEEYKTSNPFELADLLGYVLIPFPFQKIKGLLLVIDGITCIGYNEGLPRRVQGLVVYHEIGHCLLHPKANYFMLLENTYFPPEKFEYQANKFTAELILSELQQSERLPQQGETIYEFAARYEVPVKLIEDLAKNK